MGQAVETALDDSKVPCESLMVSLSTMPGSRKSFNRLRMSVSV